MLVKYVGLTAEAARILELHRVSPDEQESDIIVRLGEIGARPADAKNGTRSEPAATRRMLDLGQGVRVRVGETLFLFLDEDAKKFRRPDGTALAKEDGLYIDGHRVQASRGSFIQPAMRHFQEKLGRVVSLSAYRQWYVLRDQKLVRLDELKDPALAKRRMRNATTLEDLGLAD